MSNPAQGASAPLIKLHNQTIQGSNVECVNARDLHLFLEVGRVFANWIKARIAQYGFVENEDYIPICQNRQIGHGKGKTEFFLTMDMAKELAMVERNEKGRQARRYFIECEKKLREESKAQGNTLPASGQSLTPELLKFIEGRSIEVAIQAKEKATRSLTRIALQELQRMAPGEVVERMNSYPGVIRTCVLMGAEHSNLYALAKVLSEQCKQLQGVLNQAEA